MARKSERETQLELALRGKTEAMELAQAIIGIGLQALGQKSLTAIALIVDSILFSAVMVWPSWERLAGAVLFSIAAWFTVYFRHERKPPHEEGPVSS